MTVATREKDLFTKSEVQDITFSGPYTAGDFLLDSLVGVALSVIIGWGWVATFA